MPNGLNGSACVVARIFACKPHLVIFWRKQLTNIFIQVSNNTTFQDHAPVVDVGNGMHDQIPIPYVNFIPFIQEALDVRVKSGLFW